MRLASYNLQNINKVHKFVDEKFNKSIFTDYFINDFEEFDYCLDTRIYDIVCINYEDYIYKKFFSIFKYIMNNNPSTKILIYINIDDSNMNLSSFVDNIETSYSSLSIELIRYSKKHIENDFILNHVVEKINEYFFDFLNIKFIDDIYINEKNGDRILKIIISENIIELKVEKEIDFNILLFFIKNYGNIVSLRYIASSITKVPENTSDSKIERSISKVRNLISEFNMSIQNFKKVGYKFILDY